MTTTNLIDVKAASTKELVAFYNAHNVDKPVSKFADRKTAEKRVQSILDSLAIIEAQGGDLEDGVIVEPTATVHKTRQSRKVNPPADTDVNADIPEEEITEEQARLELEAMKAAASKKPVGSKSGLTLSAAIAASWNLPGVAEKRMTRNGVTVTVNGKSGDFKSVAAAFGDLKLPMSKHIRFRMLVKKEGSAIFEHEGQKYHFEMTAFNDEDAIG